jgi:hypothetical protein
LHQAFGPQAADAQIDADACEQHRVGEDPQSMEIDEHGRVAEPG